MELTMIEKENTNQGICITCTYKDNCLQKPGDGMVIWYCEHFDDYVPQKPHSPSSNKKSDDKCENNDSHLGLCSSCEYKTECIHSKTPGGIWFCNDYT